MGFHEILIYIVIPYTRIFIKFMVNRYPINTKTKKKLIKYFDLYFMFCRIPFICYTCSDKLISDIIFYKKTTERAI